MPFCMTRSNDLVEASACKEFARAACVGKGSDIMVATCQKYDVRQNTGCLHPVQKALDAYLSETSTNHWPQQIALKHGVLKQTRSHITRACNTSLPCWIVRIFGHCVSHFADNVLQTFLWQVNFLRHMAHLSHIFSRK